MRSAPQQRSNRGRFTTRVPRDPIVLYTAVREMALQAWRAADEPFNPARITQRLWNTTKASSPAHRDLPNANEICRQLGGRDGPLPWHHVLEVALDETLDPERVHTALSSTQDEIPVDEQRVFFSLNRVARELGQDWLSIIDYIHGYQRLVVRARRSKSGALLEQQLLTIGQINGFVDWPTALRIAALNGPPERSSRALPRVDAAVRVYRQTGKWPSSRTLERYAREHGVSLQQQPQGVGWPALIEQARQLVHEEDGVAPARYVPRDQPTWNPPAEPVLQQDEVAPGRPNYERPELIVEVLRFLGQLKRGQRPSRTSWHAFAREHGAPSVSVLDGHGGLPALIREASRPGAKQQADLELEQLRSVPVEQLQLERRAAQRQARQVLDAIRTLGSPNQQELREHLGWSTVEIWVRALRDTSQITAITGATADNPWDIRYVLAGCEPPPPLENDPAAVRAATSNLGRLIHEELVKSGPATAAGLADRIGRRHDSVVRQLSLLAKTGFVTGAIQTVPGGGRTTVYTANNRPLADRPRWSTARQHVHDAIVELGEAPPRLIAEKTGMSTNTLKPHLAALVKEGEVERVAGSCYRPTIPGSTDHTQRAHVATQ